MNKKIGLLLGDENDWCTSVEHMFTRLAKNTAFKKAKHTYTAERIRIHPFSLDADTEYAAVIDRLAYWHNNPREWLKKSAFVNDTYLLNNPFTFQSMEKHTAYCAMMRLGLNIPETWMIPTKQAIDTDKFRTTAERYHDMFDIKEVAEKIGYPMYMKPFDGGGWRGVSSVKNEADLIEAYETSGDMLMHLQKGLDGFDVFVRSLGIGPQVSSFNYDPEQPQHGRYLIDHNFLTEEQGNEARIVCKLINSFFRWDFNSCETILKDGIMSPIDFANACPDVAITSLHYYFPWAVKSLVAWSTFAVDTDRHMSIDMHIKPYTDIADSDRSYQEKLVAYEALSDEHFQTDKFNEFKATVLKDMDSVMWDYVQTNDFDDMLTSTVKTFFPDHEHDEYIAHYRGLMEHWVEAEK